MNEALKLPEVVSKLKGAEIIGGSSQEFAVFMTQETAKWGKLIRELDLKAD